MVDLENKLVSQKKSLAKAFVFSSFSYFPLVWHFTSIRSTNKKESIQDRVLQLLYNDYTRTYHRLFAKANKPSMELKCYRTLAFKTLNLLNPMYMHYLLCSSSSSAGQPNNIAIVRTNKNTYGTKSLRSLGPQIWNFSPEHIKAETSCCLD